MANTTTTSTTNRHPSPYDIIIIGGGTAGLVLASRLSNPSTTVTLKVLLLESGSDPSQDPRISTPMLFSAAIGDPSLDWNYTAAPQPGLNGKATVHPRGKGLGGSSLINLMQLAFPSRAGQEAWRGMLGEQQQQGQGVGWGWEDMVPYLRRFHRFIEPEVEEARVGFGLRNSDASARGTEGPVQASFPDVMDPVERAWVETFARWEEDDYLEGARDVGAFRAASTVDPVLRERSHVGVAYLTEEVRAQPNLSIVTNATVTRVLFAGKKATGVEYIHDGETCQANARKEVVLCCGAFNTPTLLERSGIGRRDVLEKLGVEPVLLNDNVGENLQDHLLVGCSFEVEDDIETLDRFRDPEFISKAMALYQESRSGPLAATFGAISNLPLMGDSKDFDVDKVLASFDGSRSTSLQLAERYVSQLIKEGKNATAVYSISSGQVHLEHTKMSEVFQASTQGSLITIWAALAHPLSRGSVHARSTEANYIDLDPRYLTHPLDVELIVRHLQMFDKIIESEPLKILLRPDGQRIPAWASHLTSRENAERLCRESSTSYNHPVGTCSMLPLESGGVVDSRLRVYGVESLRICDASVIPIIPRGPIMSTVYAVAEKAADIIRADLEVDT